MFFFLSAIKYSQERPLITEDPPHMCCLIQACNPKNARRGDMDVFGKAIHMSVVDLNILNELYGGKGWCLQKS